MDTVFGSEFLPLGGVYSQQTPKKCQSEGCFKVLNL
jgi:hypothetical protein